MQEIVSSVIDKPPSEWEVWRETKREQYFNFNKSFPDNTYFCDSVLSSKPNFENIQLVGRIGSSSADAEVFKVRYNSLDFALKIMPRIDDDSEKKNKNEIITATEASKYKEYFPLTFAYGYCPESGYYISANNQVSSFIPKAIEYGAIQDMLNKLSSTGTKKRFDSDYRHGMSIKGLETKYSVISDVDGIQVDFLISELANGDLGNWMMIERSLEEWKNILIDIMTGIYYLTVMVEKVHPDLHPGNVLIANYQNRIRALIHDFGRTYPIDLEIPQTLKGSLMSFCSEFIKSSSREDLIIPRKVLLAIETIETKISGTVVTLENIKSIYEEFIFPTIVSIISF